MYVYVSVSVSVCVHNVFCAHPWISKSLDALHMRKSACLLFKIVRVRATVVCSDGMAVATTMP